MVRTSVANVKARLSEYLERVERGERIVICRHNKPVAELGPVENSRTEPRPLGPVAGRPAFAVGQAFIEPLSAAEIDAWEGGVFPSLAKPRASGAARASKAAEPRANYENAVPSRAGARRRRA